MAGSDPVYMVVRSAEEKERWIYFLKKAAGDSNFNGTEFEIFLQKMMSQNTSDSKLWTTFLFYVIFFNLLRTFHVHEVALYSLS